MKTNEKVIKIVTDAMENTSVFLTNQGLETAKYLNIIIDRKQS